MPLCLFWVLCCIKPSGPPATAHCDHAGLQAHGPTTSALPRWLLSIFQPFQLPSTFRSVSRWVLKTTLKKNQKQQPSRGPPKTDSVPREGLQTGCAWDISTPGTLLGPSSSPSPSPSPSPPQAGGMAHSRQDMATLKQKGTSPSCWQLLISALA